MESFYRYGIEQFVLLFLFCFFFSFILQFDLEEKKLIHGFFWNPEYQYRDVRDDECLGSLIKLMKRLPITNLTKPRVRCIRICIFRWTAHRLLHSSIRFLRRSNQILIFFLRQWIIVVLTLVNYSRLILRLAKMKILFLWNIFHNSHIVTLISNIHDE